MQFLLIAAMVGIVIYVLHIAVQSSVGFDSAGDLSMVDQSANSVTVNLAQAIAFAEGFYVSGSRPARNHNPGDMKADLIGRANGFDSDGFAVYATDDDGWKNLYAQVNAWLNGTSRYHSSQSTIADLAGLGSETGYTSTDQASWASNVAAKLGVETDTQIGALS